MPIRNITLIASIIYAVFLIGTRDSKIPVSATFDPATSWNQLYDGKLQSAFKQCNVPYEKCARIYKTIANTRKGAKKAVTIDNRIPTEIVTLVYEVAADFGISDKELSINYDDNNKLGEAWVRGMTIYINPERISAYSEKAQRYIIAHEMSHIVHDDCTWRDAMRTAKFPQDAIDQIIKVQEINADLYAYTKNKVYAQGGIECYEQDLKWYGNTDHKTHPCNQDRLIMAQNILNQIPAARAA